MRACQPKDSKRREWRSTRGRERERDGGERERVHARWREREIEKALWLLLLYVFSSTWACPMQIELSQECCLSYLKSSLWSLELPLTFLCSIFTGFPLPCLLATTILDSFSLVYLPNIPPSRDGRPSSLGIGVLRSLWLLPVGLPLLLVSSLRVLIVVSKGV